MMMIQRCLIWIISTRLLNLSFTIGNVLKYLLFLSNDTPSCRAEIDTLELEAGIVGKVRRETIRPTIEAFLVYCFEKIIFRRK